METTVGSRKLGWAGRVLAFSLVGAMAAAACGSSSTKESSDNSTGGSKNGPVTLHLGYFPNVTHAPAVYGVQSGNFAKALGSNVTFKPSVFNAGPAATTALLSGA